MQSISRHLFTRRTFPLFLLLFIVGLTGCSVEEEQILDRRNYRQVWSDEFDGPAGELPNPDNWKFDIGTGDNGWGNGEFQYYTDRPENVSLDGNGNLVLTARRETFAGANFTSARITTEDRMEQQYGRIEARLKTPYGPGIWPAFWMLGDNCDEIFWPQCGEIDILELRGQEPSIINGTVHGPGYSAGASITGEYALENGRFDTEYRVFAVEWGEDYIDWFVDDVLYFRVTPDDLPGEWVYDHPFYLILNIAVGGSYVGFPTSRTPFPQEMIVDYVRVYEQVGND